MATILLTVLCFLAVVYFTENWMTWEEISVIVVFVGFLGAIVAIGLGLVFPYEYERVNHRTLTALEDTSGTSGSFFLGSGSVGSRQYYFYMYKRDGGYRQDSIRADRATVYEVGGDTELRIEKYQHSGFKKNWHGWIAFPVSASYYYDVYVPEGAIRHGYNVDLK